MNKYIVIGIVTGGLCILEYGLLSSLLAQVDHILTHISAIVNETNVSHVTNLLQSQDQIKQLIQNYSNLLR